MNIIKKILILIAILPIAIMAKTINLDKDISSISLTNNKMNLLVMPFVVQEAKLSTETPDNFQIIAKNTSIIIVPTASDLKEGGDLIVWSIKGNAYLVKINAEGSVQRFVFATNSSERSTPTVAKQYETGKIESDIKKLMKKTVAGDKIPGYKKIDVKRIFETPDLTMQKEYFYDGGKYRVETWFLENKTKDILTLDYENFYTNGILSIAFEKKVLRPGQVGKLWLVVNKSSIAAKIKKLDR